MDDKLDQRWRDGIKPFDGVTIYLSDEILLSDLRRIVSEIVSLLSASFPDVSLFKLFDWHEHDGFIDSRTSSNWTEVHFILVSDESLIAAGSDDFAVRTAFYPEGFEFYLRIYVEDEPYDQHVGRCGTFDLTCSPEFVARIKNSVPHAYPDLLQIVSAKSFFDDRYRG